jgi:hypothetical protein
MLGDRGFISGRAGLLYRVIQSPASHLSTGVSFSGGRNKKQSTHISAKVKSAWSYSLTPSMYSWHDAQLATRATLTFALYNNILWICFVLVRKLLALKVMLISKCFLGKRIVNQRVCDGTWDVSHTLSNIGRSGLKTPGKFLLYCFFCTWPLYKTKKSLKWLITLIIYEVSDNY